MRKPMFLGDRNSTCLSSVAAVARKESAANAQAVFTMKRFIGGSSGG
jgi:hypothetical protein